MATKLAIDPAEILVRSGRSAGHAACRTLSLRRR
jgi:hypothetical protein